MVIKIAVDSPEFFVPPVLELHLKDPTGKEDTFAALLPITTMSFITIKPSTEIDCLRFFNALDENHLLEASMGNDKAQQIIGRHPMTRQHRLRRL